MQTQLIKDEGRLQVAHSSPTPDPIRRNDHVYLNYTPTTGCDAHATGNPKLPGYTFIGGGRSDLTGQSDGVVADKHLQEAKRPLYVEQLHSFRDDKTVDLIFHGWVDLAVNYKICAWAARAPTARQIAKVEAMLIC